MAEHHETMMRLLDCHDPYSYRKKIKGFHYAFNTVDKSRIAHEDTSKKYKYKSTVAPDEMKMTLD